ncbi:MAG: DUF4157 domain-containing protein, partial [Allosphingosinicella sp.]
MRCHADPKRAAAPIQRRTPAKDGLATSTMPPPEPATRDGLPTPLRSNLEALSGFSLVDVRVRANSAEPATLGALAFARGSDIHLGPGQEKHLPHEAWHVVQQKQGRVKATAQMKEVEICEQQELEAEADRMGSEAGRGRTSQPGDAGVLHRVAVSTGGIMIQRRRIPRQADFERELPRTREDFEKVKANIAPL